MEIEAVRICVDIIDHIQIIFLDAYSSRRIAFYAIFDGHGGVRAARFAADHLPRILADKLPHTDQSKMIEQSLKKAFIDTYKHVDQLFLADAMKSKPVWKDGTTATTILILNNNLFIANIGDSRAILCRYKTDESKLIALQLTNDHSPLMFDERMRIQKAGGIVKDGRIMGILEVSRSIGDGALKNHGVICTPDIKKCTLSCSDRYILIACDGLWKTFSNQQVVEFIADALKTTKVNDESLSSSIETKGVNRLKWECVCGQLAAEAVRRGCGDNVTVVIVPLNETS